MKYTYCPIVLCCTIAFASCYWDKADQLYPTGGCSTAAVTYSGTIKAIMDQNCALSGCHNSAASAGVNLTSVAGAQSIALDGRLLGVVNHASGFSPMPKNSPKLDTCTIRQITTWVTDGAPNN